MVGSRSLYALIAVVLLVSASVFYLYGTGTFFQKPTYEVRPGDSLSKIGAEVEIPWEFIAQANKIPPPYLITPGQELIIPSEDPSCMRRQTSEAPTIVYSNENVSRFSPPRYVLLRFDDSYQDQWVNAVPVMAKYGLRAVFAVIVGSVLGLPLCGLGFSTESMNWQEVLALYAAGNEVSDHTMTHVDLNHQNLSSLGYEITQSRALMLERGITDVTSLTLPYGRGATNQTVTCFAASVGLRYVYTLEGNEGNANGILGYDSGSIKVEWFDVSQKSGTNDFRNFTAIVDRASPTFVVGLTFHHVTDHLIGGSRYYVNLTSFDRDMAYLGSSDFTVILPRQLPGY